MNIDTDPGTSLDRKTTFRSLSESVSVKVEMKPSSLKWAETFKTPAESSNLKKTNEAEKLSEKLKKLRLEHAHWPNRRTRLTAGLPPTPPPRSPPSYRREETPPKDSVHTSQTDPNTQTQTETETFLATAARQQEPSLPLPAPPCYKLN